MQGLVHAHERDHREREEEGVEPGIAEPAPDFDRNELHDVLGEGQVPTPGQVLVPQELRERIHSDGKPDEK